MFSRTCVYVHGERSESLRGEARCCALVEDNTVEYDCTVAPVALQFYLFVKLWLGVWRTWLHA